ARHALTPALIRGPPPPAIHGRVAANPASLPGYPRINACVRPSWLTGRSDQNQKQDQNLAAACLFHCRSRYM
ncbi:hypothetical protein M5G24_18330, partial [Pseudomonas sp. TNT2022 ID1048]|nr:hypothetical protein [Pseudomonas idahonensis]